ncbi:MAG: hypothetical protein ACYDAD_09535 [Acidimicrobiales bacterium]
MAQPRRLTSPLGRCHWTTIGNVSSPAESVVDPAGLLTPWPRGWSLDWWVGADDRWHLPSQEPGVRQCLLDAAPVIETAMRVPGGDALHRVYAVVSGSQELAVLELENRSRLPFALALVIQSRGPDSPVHLGRIDLLGSRVRVDGHTALLLPARPSRVATSASGEDACEDIVLGGGAEAPPADPATPLVIRSRTARAAAAFVFPMAHGAVFRAGVPLGYRGRKEGRFATARGAAPGGMPSAVPPAAAVARGWRAHARRGMRVVLPDGRLGEAVEANRRYLLVFHDGPGAAPRAAPSLAPALDRWGFHDEAAEALASRAARGRLDGPAVFALAEHWRLCRDAALARSTAGAVARAARAARAARSARSAKRELRTDPVTTMGLLLDAAELLDAAGEYVAAAAALRSAELCRAHADPGAPVLSSGGAATAATAATTITAATAATAPKDEPLLAQVDGLLGSATSTWTWSDAYGGHSRRATALFLSLVRDILLTETQDALVLLPTLSRSWLGQPVEVHDAPTRHGPISFALRWHGERPALLWDLRRHDDGCRRLRAPGLDPAWSTNDPQGEVLLSRPVFAQMGGGDGPGSEGEASVEGAQGPPA